MDQDLGNQDACFGSGSIAGAVIGTFLTTILLLAVAALFYRQWRRHKGKHLVLVTDPEIVEDTYAFDNPCFKDVTNPAIARTIERPISVASVASAETPVKDATRWSTSWSSLGLGSVVRNDKRRTLDDSCLGPKATRVGVVSLRSRDFTGLGFNVCGNMREGIFVKDLLHRGPASESGRIHPGDRIASVKISFRNMVYEDALTILSYASPYDVELEVESGGAGSRPTTLLKKSVGPSPAKICHPFYRSQSIPELSQSQKSVAKRLFTADLGDALGSSPIKSPKSTGGGNHTPERHHSHEESTPKSSTNHQKFGIKVLPALDGTVHKIENQNEHNTNLERRNSKKIENDENLPNSKNVVQIAADTTHLDVKRSSEKIQQRENGLDLGNSRARGALEQNGIDVPDKGDNNEERMIPEEIPEEVHNAAVAARRNRRNSAELLGPNKISKEMSRESNLNLQHESESDRLETKSPLQKNKRKAPAPPKEMVPGGSPEEEKGKIAGNLPQSNSETAGSDDKFDSITDYAESLSDYLNKVRETTDGAEARRQRLENQTCRRNSESDTDSELQNSFTTIELNPADITIHHTPVPEADDDVYRKAASLGDLSKYESRATSTLERAQSLDMTDTSASKKRKAPLPPEDINESTEDLSKLDDMDTFQRRKLKKSNEWGTLEDAIWARGDTGIEEQLQDGDNNTKMRKRSKGTLERSKSAVEIKPKFEETLRHFDASNLQEGEVSVELYNLPLSKRLSLEFIRGERMFDPDEDNSLARLVNDGNVVKSPTFEEVELDFRQAKPLLDDEREARVDLEDALAYFDVRRSAGEEEEKEGKIEKREIKSSEAKPIYLTYENVEEVREEPMKKITVDTSCPGCRRALNGERDGTCNKHSFTAGDFSEDSKIIPDIIQTTKEPMMTVFSGGTTTPSTYLIEGIGKRESVSTFLTNRTKFETPKKESTQNDNAVVFETNFGKRIADYQSDAENPTEDVQNVTVINSKVDDRRNVSNVSVTDRGEAIVKESENTPPLPSTPMPFPAPHKMTYITEIKVSTSRENLSDRDVESENEEIVGIMGIGSPERRLQGVTVTSNGKTVAGKKPPIPPRRSEASKASGLDAEKQVVYVSEMKSTTTGQVKDDEEVPEVSKAVGGIGKKFEQWVFLGENKENPWGNNSGQPQPVTNIILQNNSNEDKINKILQK
ncbi:uncharacterized protein LOC105691107 [Athalia rosae]|uniref:uncharacterized protein LOC105691107 n=1 Tax=Athalia rosae TaxID=37344 RepID=UPI0020334909|nr:uncharacterized protein LOC105691107 [Athalia rosae]